MGVQKTLEAFGNDFVVRLLVKFFFWAFFSLIFLDLALVGLYESLLSSSFLNTMMHSSLARLRKKSKS